jgi:Asp-tRNA(Asn)/Glu-tRNA(Gln) amidotransferase A subunit family amidase
MSMPWTHGGFPSVTIPAARAACGLPLGLQLAAPFMADEKLLYWAQDIEARINLGLV